MSMLGKIPLHGFGYGVYKGSATGPSSDVNVGSGASGTISISITNPFGKAYMAINGIYGLPDGVDLKGWKFNGTDTLEIYVYNPTGAAVTVSANAVTVEYTLFQVPS